MRISFLIIDLSLFKKLIIVFFFLISLCPFLRAEPDPFLPLNKVEETKQLAQKAFQMNRQFPPLCEDEILSIIEDKYSGFGKGHPAQEAVLVRLFSHNGVSFEDVPGSFIWVARPLSDEHGFRTGSRALCVVIQTDENLQKIEEIVDSFESAFADYRSTFELNEKEALELRRDALIRINKLCPPDK